MRYQPRGFFIDIEGPDGCGKGTQAQLLVAKLQEDGYKVVHTREPGGTPIAEAIREVILRKGFPEQFSTTAEVLAFSAARAQHVDNLIVPSLSEGKVVVTERFYPSTFAYQCAGRGVPRDLVHQATELATRGLQPNVVVLLDLPVEIGLRRKAAAASNGAPQLDRFELEKLEFHERVRQSYLHMAQIGMQAWNQKYVVIDATQSIEEVAVEVRKAVADVDYNAWDLESGLVPRG